MKLNRIKTELVERDKSQQWLAEQIGKSFSTVNAYCCNRQQPSLEILDKVVKMEKYIKYLVRNLFAVHKFPTFAYKS